MPAVAFNLSRLRVSSSLGLTFILGITAADYTCAITVDQTQQSLASARVYTYLTLPAAEVAWNRAKVLDREWGFTWERSVNLDTPAEISWRRAKAIELSWLAAWRRGSIVDPPGYTLNWARAASVDVSSAAFKWGNTKAKDVASNAVCWGRAVAIDAATYAISWREPPRKEVDRAIAWVKTVAVDIETVLPYKEGPVLDADLLELPWNRATPILDYLIPKFPTPIEPELPPYGLQKGRGFACFHLDRSPQPNANSYVLNRRLNNDQCFPGAFIVNNTFSAKTLHDNLPIDLLGFSASTDIGSNAWAYTIGLPKLAELNRIKPTVSGPIELEVTLNGYVFRMVVEDYDETRTHSSWGYSATGHGLTVYASAPFAAQASAVLPTAQRTAAQIANDAVAPLGGFTVNWEALNYLVQPSMLSYSDTDPLGVVSRLATAIGAIVIPHRYNKEFTVRSHYPVSPWEWSLPGTPVAQVISKALNLRSGGAYRANPVFNKVYVAATASGYNAGVKRSGTAGDRLAPQITEALLSQPAGSPTASGNLERGRVELAKSGPRREYTIVTPLVAANVTPGVRLREPTELVEVEDDEGMYKAQVGKVSVTMTAEQDGKIKVYQTLGLERYV